MKRSVILSVLFFVQTVFLLSCTKTVAFRQSDQKVRPLKTEAKIIRLHEDFLYAEREALPLKQLVIEKIARVMSQQSRFQYEFIPSGTEVPRNDSTHETIFLIGDIWMNQGKTSGNQVVKVNRSQNGFGYSENWEDIELRTWDRNALQTAISLYFIEVGAETRILRATITVSDDKKQEVRSGGHTISDKQFSGFTPDEKLQPGYHLIQANTNINSQGLALEDLATQAVAVHFDTLY